MPRPKVRPEARRRAVVACVPCQMSKKKCDSRTPCANCCRRSYEANCVYDPKACPRPSRRSGSLSTIQARRPAEIAERRSSFVTQSGDFGIESSSCADNRSINGLQIPRTPESTLAPCSNATPNDSVSPGMSNIHGDLSGSRPMGNSGAGKVSMGDSASLSFLDFLRHTFHYYMGPSPFTDKQMAKAMLEAVFPLRVSDDIQEGSPESQLNVEEKKDYLDRFFIATTGLIYLYSPQEMLIILEDMEPATGHSPEKPNSPKYGPRDAVVDMAIAIGGQGCGTTPKSLYHAQRHFNRAQKFAFEGMLLDPSIDMVAVFLMMSTYMLNGCKRNGAFIYLGVAARLAQSLGLHVTETYQHLPSKERRFRSQVWKSLRILDIAFGAVLSQTPASASSPRSRFGDAFFSVSDDLEPKSPEYNSMSASFEVCLILEQITDHLDHGQETDLVSIQDFLRRLRELTEGLPASVKMSTVSSTISSEQRRQTLGNFAVSCFYYYSVILVTRPVLISNHLANLKRLDQSSNTSFDVNSARETDEIAQVCVDAAILLVETTRRAHSVGLLLQQMALLKAWLFSACLILGFSIFVDITLSETPSTLEAEAALRGGIFVIRDLAQTSPQAHHYLDVLTELQSAIHKYRERLVPPKKKKGGQFLSQIFILDQDKSVLTESVPDTSTYTPSMAAEPSDDTSGAGLWMLQQAAEASQGVNNIWRISDDNAPLTDPSLSGPVGAGGVPLSVGGFDLHWGSISVQATDDFLFATDSFAGMLDQF